MSAITNCTNQDLYSEDKENFKQEKSSKGGKSELREMKEWHNTCSKLEEDQMEEEMLMKKRKMQKQSVQNYNIKLVKCQEPWMSN